MVLLLLPFFGLRCACQTERTAENMKYLHREMYHLRVYVYIYSI